MAFAATMVYLVANMLNQPQVQSDINKISNKIGNSLEKAASKTASLTASIAGAVATSLVTTIDEITTFPHLSSPIAASTGVMSSFSTTVDSDFNPYAHAYRRTRSTTKSDTKDITISKSKTQKMQEDVYYVAEVTHPGAVVYKMKPIPFEGAVIRASQGADVYAQNDEAAIKLASTVSNRFGNIGYEGPTNDGNPQNAKHYHPITDDPEIRPHIFYGDDPNLTMSYKMWW